MWPGASGVSQSPVKSQRYKGSQLGNNEDRQNISQSCIRGENIRQHYLLYINENLISGGDGRGRLVIVIIVFEGKKISNLLWSIKICQAKPTVHGASSYFLIFL